MRRPARASAAGVRAAGLAALVAALSAAGGVRAAEPLQPYQLVRSLQLVQDRLAAGDHAALPMQAKLLELADASFRGAGPDELDQPLNLRALLVYGMSGGNPATVQAAVARVELDPANQAVFRGVVSYLSGDPAGAVAALRDVDPMSLPEELGAFTALVKGSLLATEEPAEALSLFDKARLLSPGTLVEEAALRRSIRIAALNGDADRFLLASTQYVGRFLHSPYASQFADSFVSGTVALHPAIDLGRLADITSMMDPERQKVIYLRIARRAAIDGLTDLSTFASARAEGAGEDDPDDPRAQLYASLSILTSDNIGAVQKRLDGIDRNRLSENDRSLLDAARAVTHEVIAPPIEPAGAAASRRGDPPDDAGLPPVEGAVAEQPAIGISPGPQAAPRADTPAVAETAGDATDNAIADARRKLETIDRMLGASPQ